MYCCTAVTEHPLLCLGDDSSWRHSVTPHSKGTEFACKRLVSPRIAPLEAT
jgi:hypothetical protein